MNEFLGQPLSAHEVIQFESILAYFEAPRTPDYLQEGMHDYARSMRKLFAHGWHDTIRSFIEAHAHL